MQKRRLAKEIASRGFCSRRKAEELILNNSVAVDGVLTNDVVTFVDDNSVISVDGHELKLQKDSIWLFYKPAGCITTHTDTHGRSTVFSLLPKDMPRVISIGRLDYNTEGLLLLTNSGQIAHDMALPQNKLKRVYRCRVHGYMPDGFIAFVRYGCTIDGVKYGPVQVANYKKQNDNFWVDLTIQEGKNREIRNIFKYFGLHVTRLIRIQFGEYSLGNMKPCELKNTTYK